MWSQRALKAVVGGSLAALLCSCGASVHVGSPSPDWNPSPDWKAQAESLIATSLARQSGFPSLKPTCQAPPGNLAVGQSFTCTAATPDGKTIRVIARRDGASHLSVDTVNVISPAGLAKLVTVAIKALGDKAGKDLPADSLDCGQGPFMDDVPLPLSCTFRDPATGASRPATLTVTDIDTGGFTIKVGG
jgi:hypothetical protein